MTSARWAVMWLVVAVLFRSSAAIFAKLAALYSLGRNIFGLVWNPWFIAELASLGVQTLAWTLVLRHRPVSRVYPYNSLVFIINLMAAHWLFNETITANHIAGIAVIVIGVLLMVRAPDPVEGSHA